MNIKQILLTDSDNNLVVIFRIALEKKIVIKINGELEINPIKRGTDDMYYDTAETFEVIKTLPRFKCSQKTINNLIFTKPYVSIRKSFTIFCWWNFTEHNEHKIISTHLLSKDESKLFIEKMYDSLDRKKNHTKLNDTEYLICRDEVKNFIKSSIL